MDVTWDYRRRQVNISMKGYVKNLLQKIQHPTPSKPKHNPHIWTPLKYGQTIQLAPQNNNLPVFPAPRIKRMQQIIGFLLYYARAVHNIILMTFNDLAADQSKTIVETEQHIHKLSN